MPKAKWSVRLGPMEWPRYTRGHGIGESLQLLGSVQRGAQVGALAVDGNGDYFQVNGEYVAPLNKRLIAKAVAAANAQAPRRQAPAMQQPKAAPPVVTVRRKRIAISPAREPLTTGDD